MLLITTSPPHLDSWLTLLRSYLEELQNGLSNLSAEDAFEITKKRVDEQQEFTRLPNDDEVSRAQGLLYKADGTKEIVLPSQKNLPPVEWDDDDDSDSLESITDV